MHNNAYAKQYICKTIHMQNNTYDIEVIPGPINTSTKKVNIGHVNIWCLLAPIKMVDPTLKHNLTKFDLVKNHI